MPIYEFRCGKCGREFEKLVFSHTGRVTCPGCSSPRVERKLSAFAMKTSSGFKPSSGGGGCGGCTSRNCSSCG